jgi:hypothetical protein
LGRLEAPVEETPLEKLNKKSVEEATNISHTEAQAKIDAAKDQPGEMYTASVTIPEYFDEPAYAKNNIKLCEVKAVGLLLHLKTLTAMNAQFL